MRRSALFIAFCLAAVAGCGRAGPAGPRVPPVPAASPPGDPGPLLARVGDVELHQADLEPLARAAVELHHELFGEDLAPRSPAQKLALAVELLALAEAESKVPADASFRRDARRRALASAYLERAMQPVDQEPVSDQELRQAQRRQVLKYLAQGESELYEPSRVDVTLIGVGLFPDWIERPDSDLPPVLDRDQVESLARSVKARCGDRVSDLDEFLAIGRQFEGGHPTLRIESHPRLALDPDLAGLPPVLQQQLVGLDGDGAVSPIVRTPGASFIIRRGATYPGRGEDLDAIRQALARDVRLERKRQRLDALLQELARRYPARTWPDRLAGDSGETRSP